MLIILFSGFNGKFESIINCQIVDISLTSFQRYVFQALSNNVNQKSNIRVLIYDLINFTITLLRNSSD